MNSTIEFGPNAWAPGSWIREAKPPPSAKWEATKTHLHQNEKQELDDITAKLRLLKKAIGSSLVKKKVNRYATSLLSLKMGWFQLTQMPPNMPDFV